MLLAMRADAPEANTGRPRIARGIPMCRVQSVVNDQFRLTPWPFSVPLTVTL